MFPYHRTHENIHKNLILPETRVLGYTSVTDDNGLSAFKLMWWAPKTIAYEPYILA